MLVEAKNPLEENLRKKYGYNYRYSEEMHIDKDAEALKKIYLMIEEVMGKMYPSAYIGGAEQLKIEWMQEGQAFFIQETDGYERIIQSDEWMMA